MSVPRESVKSKIGFLVASLNRQLGKEIEEQARHLQLSVDQVRVLEALSEAGGPDGLMMSELARLAVIDASNLTKVIDRMVSESLVYRGVDPSDRRRVKVLLAQRGQSLFKQLKPLLARQEADLQATIKKALGSRNRRDLVFVLEQLCERDISKSAVSKAD